MSRPPLVLSQTISAPAIALARRKLAGLLGVSAISRGGDYAMAGRAKIEWQGRRGRQVEIESLCLGSRPMPYQQMVTLSFDESGALEEVEGDCTCPMELDCKHVASVALVWLATQAPVDPVRRAPDASEGPETLLIPSDSQQWLRRFEAALTHAPRMVPKGECVLYALREEGRTLQILKARILKDGRMTPVGYSTPDLGWLRAGRAPPRYLVTPDVAVCQSLARLRESQGSASGWSIEGEEGRIALDRALATGRLRYFGDEEWQAFLTRRLELRLDSEGWLTPGPRLAAPLVPVASEFGGLRWGVRSIDGERTAAFTAIAVSPPVYLDRSRCEIGELDTGESEAVACMLLAMPEIETRNAAVFFSLLGDVARARGIESVAGRIPAALVLKHERPQPRLRIERGNFRQFARGKAADTSLWVAELWFDYPQGPSLPEGPHDAAGARWRDSEGVEQLLLRDTEMEAATRRKLSAAGFPPASTSYGLHQRIDAKGPYMMPRDGSDRSWAEAAQRLFQVAHAAGARIDADPEFPHRPREATEIDASLTPAQTPQWFDLELGVTIDGAHVPIVAALAEWIARTPNPQAWLEKTADDSPVLLHAGAAGLIRVPAGRLKQLLTPLLDTFGFERELVDGKLRLSRIEAALIAAPGAGARAAAELARLRERLRDFRGVASVTPSATFRGRLRPYQQAGLDWLQFLREYGLAGILADDMGLGKTVQALAHLDLEKASGRASGPSIVVAPTSVLPNWREEAERFAPALRVLTLHGPRRGEQHSAIAAADLVLTTYPLLARDREALAAHEYHVAVFDEAQFLKNARTQTRAAAAALRARHRLAMSGTPIENNLAELWSHFDLLLPGFLGDAKQFARAWRTPIEREQDGSRMARLAKRVRPFILRRTRSEVLEELPAKTEIVRHVELEGAQRDLYESLRMALDRSLRRAISSKGIAGSQIVILDALLKLRQACCDPRLVKAPAAKAAHGASAKLDALREMLEELRAEGKRVLLFSQFTSMLDLIEPELPALGVRHVRLDGSTVDRATPVKRFQAGEADVFLISLRAGGTGLNLTAADTVIHYDPWWNPAVEAQATARAHRMGQDKAVFVYKLIALGTVEERIVELVKRKQALADALLGEGKARGPLITEDDIRLLLAPIGETL